MMVKMPYNKKILIVDDDAGILRMLDTVLRKAGYTHIYKASSGEEAVRMATSLSPDLVLLDVMLPDVDGYEVCKNIRLHSMVPILFLSAKSDEVDRLLSYAMGGDAYLTKPFSPRELLAKIKAILVRQQYYETDGKAPNTYAFGKFVLDMDKMMLFCDGKNVPLTAKEYALLEYLVRNKNVTISRKKLLETIWDVDYDGYDNTVMVHIRHLREKIEENPSEPIYIQTVKGRGYVFADA